MNKRDALKLEPGAVIIYGDSMWSAKCQRHSYAKVVSVSPNGGIKCRDIDYSGRTVGADHWVPYHYVITVHDHAPMPTQQEEETMFNRSQTSCVAKTFRQVVLFETPKAISICFFGCLDPQHRTSIWLPKSAVTIVAEENGYSTITIPGWLVEKHGLVDAPFEHPKGGSANDCGCLRKMSDGRRQMSS